MYKKLLIIILMTVSLAGLTQENIDVIHFNNGSIVKGKLIEQDSEFIKIETLCENVLVFPLVEVSQVSNELYKPPNSLKNEGYYNFTSFGVLMSTLENDRVAPLSVLMEHNYRLFNYFAPGIVTGIELLNETVYPAGMNIKIMLPLNKGSNLFFGISGGYTFSPKEPVNNINYEITSSYGGSMIYSEIGMIMPSYTNTSFFIAIGFRYNELHYKREDWWLTEVDQTIYYNRLMIRLGLAVH